MAGAAREIDKGLTRHVVDTMGQPLFFVRASDIRLFHHADTWQLLKYNAEKLPIGEHRLQLVQRN
ncbi:hypothetical protein [Paenibacillus sp. FJAT-27812]|uniref:hypothetical protein n=1 Tax=Paenibacillus sp. FJAT-27812 TaxID=1684143 RepID=UPI0006A7A719|nr:hypothetical protein [Paenibacillus sp. FJAT-27812]